MPRTLNLNSLADLELLRQAMIDWLSEYYETEYEPVRPVLNGWTTAQLAKRVNRFFDGGLRAFVEADPELSLAC